MSEDALNSSEAGRGYLTRYERAIAGKTQEQFEAGNRANGSRRLDAWNAAVETARQGSRSRTRRAATLSEQCGACPWPPPLTPTSQYRPTRPVPRHAGTHHAILAGRFPVVSGRGRRAVLRVLPRAARHDDRRMACACGARIYRSSSCSLPQWIDGKTAGRDRRRSDAAGRCCARPNGTPRSPSTTCTPSARSTAANTTTSIPLDKRTPGERLANCALRQIYGMDRVPVHGPTVLGFRCDPNGRVRLFFRYAHGLHFEGTTPGGRRR